VDLAQLDAKMDDSVGSGHAHRAQHPGRLRAPDRRDLGKLVHDRGGFVYMDGANLNAFVGRGLPGLMGADAMHINLHKTFSTPHGGGGPGAGPVVVSEALVPHLPVPRVVKEGDAFRMVWSDDASIGSLRGFASSFLVLVRALTYIRGAWVPTVCVRCPMTAVLYANLVRHRLKNAYHLKYDQPEPARGGLRRQPADAERACTTPTSPSGCWTTASIRRP
jgi:glycine dehydrogenase subunit 2